MATGKQATLPFRGRKVAAINSLSDTAFYGVKTASKATFGLALFDEYGSTGTQ